MTADAVAILGSLFDIIWRLFTSWHIPGTNVTPASLAFFFVSAGIGLRFVLQFFSSAGSASSAVRDAKVIKKWTRYR